MILVIDDEEMVRDLIATALERAGHEVVTAVDGEEGLVRFRERRPEVVVTDMIMPNRDGIETILALQQEAPEVPVIAICGVSRGRRLNYLAMAVKLGAVEALPKPFAPQDLVEAVGRALARRRPGPEPTAPRPGDPSGSD